MLQWECFNSSRFLPKFSKVVGNSSQMVDRRVRHVLVSFSCVQIWRKGCGEKLSGGGFRSCVFANGRQFSPKRKLCVGVSVVSMFFHADGRLRSYDFEENKKKRRGNLFLVFFPNLVRTGPSRQELEFFRTKDNEPLLHCFVSCKPSHEFLRLQGRSARVVNLRKIQNFGHSYSWKGTKGTRMWMKVVRWSRKRPHFFKLSKVID